MLLLLLSLSLLAAACSAGGASMFSVSAGRVPCKAGTTLACSNGQASAAIIMAAGATLSVKGSTSIANVAGLVGCGVGLQLSASLHAATVTVTCERLASPYSFFVDDAPADGLASSVDAASAAFRFGQRAAG